MILQALARYYEILAEDPDTDIAPPLYNKVWVSYALNISLDGDLLDIFPLVTQVKRGDRIEENPVRLIVPEQIKRSGRRPPANFLCDNSAYMLGISEKDKDDPEYSNIRFNMFREYHLNLLGDVECPEAKAVVHFLKKFDSSHAKEHPVLSRHLTELLQGKNIVFNLDGVGYVHKNPEIKKVWEKYRAEKSGYYTGQCLVTGEIEPIARLHPSIKGIRGANSMGATLVGFNDQAYESYNKGQGLNAPTSEKAVFAYTTALNYLLSSENPNPKFTIGDTTVVYWAESPDKTYESVFLSLMNPNEIDSGQGKGSGGNHRAGRRMKEISDKIKSGSPIDKEYLLSGLDENTRFYVLGLAPNAARVSVRFFHVDLFSKFINQILAHYEDMGIVHDYEQNRRYSVYAILQETVSKKSSVKTPSPLMAGAVFRSILNGSPYPAALFYALINRIRADTDDSKLHIQKINAVRAGLIKAYLLRKYRYQKIPEIQEVLAMNLNEKSTNKAYLLGRLFSVLEKAQQDAAAPSKLNATIKDRYFTAACASPASVFSILLRLSQHHISKAKYGYVSDRQIEEIMNLVSMDDQPIPKHLSLDEQGIFVLGYYHQRQALYTKKENNQIETEL